MNHRKTIKSLILAAGYATRLYPLTESFPKPLLEVKGKTILDWLLDDIESSGLVDEHIVVTNSKFVGIFNDWARKRSRACSFSELGAAKSPGQGLSSGPRPVTVLDDGTCSNEGRLGAVRDIAFAMETLSPDGDLLVLAGDNLLDFSLSRFIEYSQGKSTSCVMRFWQDDLLRLARTGVLEIGEDDRVVGMEEKPAMPRSNWSCPPFYYLTSSDASRVAQAIVDGCGTDAPGSLVAYLAEKSIVHAMLMPGTRFDIGTIETYEQVKSSYPGILPTDAPRVHPVSTEPPHDPIPLSAGLPSSEPHPKTGD